MGRQLVTQVFVRLQAGVAEYATLDERSVAGWGRPEAVAYRRRFTDAAQTQAGFWAETHEAADALVGRHGELARVHAALGGGRGGGARRLWLSGPMGQGKSALAAKASVEAQGRGEVVIAHFFRSADPRCSLRAFVGLALETLDPESAVGDLKKDSARLRTLLAERAPLVVCDGLDELERATSTQEVEDLLALSTRRGDLALRRPTQPRRPGQQSRAHPALRRRPRADGDHGPPRPGGEPGPSGGPRRHRAPRHLERGRGTGEPLRGRPGRAGRGPAPLRGAHVGVVGILSLRGRDQGPHCRRLEDPRQVLPAGLDALYAQLVDGWGLGTLATIKTFLLCLLCAAAEPVDAQSIAALCFGDGGFLRAPTSEEERTADVALCDEVLSLFAPVLRLVNDADGRLGWRIFHDSFRGYLADPANEAVAPVFASARQSLARFGADPERSAHEPLRRHLYRHGITYLRAEGDQAQADALLSDFDYLYRRLECLKVQGWRASSATSAQRRSPRHPVVLLRALPGSLLPSPGHRLGTPPESAPARLRQRHPRDHLFRQGLVRRPPPPALYRIAGGPFGAGPIVFEGHGGTCTARWSSATAGSFPGRRTARFDCGTPTPAQNWVLPSRATPTGSRRWSCQTAGSSRGRGTTRSGSGTPKPVPRWVHHSRATPRVLGALELRDGRILSWSCDHTLRLWDPTPARRSVRPSRATPTGWPARWSSATAAIMSWSADRTLRLWDSETGEALGPPLEGHTEGIRRAGAPRRSDPVVVGGPNAPAVGSRHWRGDRPSPRGPQPGWVDRCNWS